MKNIEKLVNQSTFEDSDIINSLKHEVKRSTKHGPKMPVVFMPQKSKVECERNR